MATTQIVQETTEYRIKRLFIDEQGKPNCEKLGRFCSMILDGEPVFILRAQDKLSPQIVKEYLNTVKDNKDISSDNKRIVINRVENAIKAINQWRKKNTNKLKLPD